MSNQNKKTPDRMAKTDLSGMGVLPPQAIEAEEAILSAMLIEEDGRTMAFSTIENYEVFYKEKHGIIFKAMKNIFDNGGKVDLITVVNELRSSSELEAVGGAYFLTELTTKVSSSANLLSHIMIVKEHWIRRENIGFGSSLIKASYDDSVDPLDTLAAYQAKSIVITELLSTKQTQTARSVLKKSLDALQAAKNQLESGNVSGMACGIEEIDKATGGFQKSDLIIIAARPGMGKTALVLQILKHPAVYLGRPVAMFSLEMNAVQLMNRLISSETDVFYSRMSRGQVSDEEMERINNGIGSLVTDNIIIDDTAGISISQLRAKASMLKLKYGIEMLIVDYIQLMTASADNKNTIREQEISQISRGLKLIAKELNIPVIALSQLSRAVEARADKRPQMSDLRESGAIEQDADVIMFPFRPEYYKMDECDIGGVISPSKNIMKVIFEKHRNGALGDVDFCCDVRTNKFWGIGQQNNIYENTLPERDPKAFDWGDVKEVFE